MQKIIMRRELSSAKPLTDDLHPLLDRIYQTRGIKSATEIEHALSGLLPYDNLMGIEEAVQCIANTLEQQEQIVIVGDFDADGATSSALAVIALHSFGAKFVDFLVPNRFEFGYGLTPEIVEVAARNKPALIITVDNGIASVDGVKLANKLGIDVVVTDHHLPAAQLPEAAAIVNPNQVGDQFASKNLAGVGVIFYVMLALRRHLKNKGWFQAQNIPEPNMSKLLDLVALGTIADVVPLDKNNRILVQQGLRRIQAGHARPGIKALLSIASKQADQLTASDLAFSIGPRLNAAGRLDDMSLGINCLMSDDQENAYLMARELDELNKERRQIETKMKIQALNALEKLHLKEGELPLGIALLDETWHQGVIGILASRIKDRYHRPVIAFATANNNELKGSARSISNVHIRDVLDAIASKNPGLITKFGGHAMAAGLSLEKTKFHAFRKAFEKEIASQLSEDALANKLITDGALSPEDFSLPMATLLRTAGPWGQHFPEPSFDNKFELIDQRLVGGKHLKLVLKLPEHDELIDAIAFNIDEAAWPNHRAECIHAVYRLDINEFRGRRKLQLIVEHMEVKNG